MQVNPKSKRSVHAFRAAARLCLIVSMWQAPLPWLHCHGADVSQANSSTAAWEFTSHLVEFHGNVGIDPDHDFGWHCHWIMPAWGHVCDRSPDHGTPTQRTVSFDPVAVSSTVSLFEFSSMTMGFVAALPMPRSMRDFLVFPSKCRRINSPGLPLMTTVLRC